MFYEQLYVGRSDNIEQAMLQIERTNLYDLRNLRDRYVLEHKCRIMWLSYCNKANYEGGSIVTRQTHEYVLTFINYLLEHIDQILDAQIF
jgi:hypothetical protein